MKKNRDSFGLPILISDPHPELDQYLEKHAGVVMGHLQSASREERLTGMKLIWRHAWRLAREERAPAPPPPPPQPAPAPTPGAVLNAAKEAAFEEGFRARGEMGRSLGRIHRSLEEAIPEIVALQLEEVRDQVEAIRTLFDDFCKNPIPTPAFRRRMREILDGRDAPPPPPDEGSGVYPWCWNGKRFYAWNPELRKFLWIAASRIPIYVPRPEVGDERLVWVRYKSQWRPCPDRQWELFGHHLEWPGKVQWPFRWSPLLPNHFEVWRPSSGRFEPGDIDDYGLAPPPDPDRYYRFHRLNGWQHE